MAAINWALAGDNMWFGKDPHSQLVLMLLWLILARTYQKTKSA